MPITLKITHELDQLEKDLKHIERGLADKAAGPAINRVINSVTSVAKKAISSETGITQKNIKADLVIRKARKDSLNAFIDAVNAKGKNLIEFVRPAQRNPETFRRRTKKGFKHAGVRAKAWGKTKTYRGTFIGRGKNSGKLLVFKRSSTGKVEGVVGPSVRNTFRSPRLEELMRRRAGERLPIELKRSIDNLIRRRR